MKKYFLFVLLFAAFKLSYSQTAPTNTRLFQPTNTFGYFNNSFIKHLNSSKSELFLSVSNISGGSYLGTPIIGFKTRFISRIKADGIPKWTAKFENETSNDWNFNAKRDLAAVDSEDNIIVTTTSDQNATFTDGFGNTEVVNYESDLNSVQRNFFKLDKNGNKIWMKKILNVGYVSVIADHFNDVYIMGTGNSNSKIDGISLGSTFIVKLNGNTGNIIYAKSFNYQSYQFIPVFDINNTMYVFTEPVNNAAPYFYYDLVSIPSNLNGSNSLMLKFDSSGNVVWGKNFYLNATENAYSWINDAVFDGTNILILGNLIKNKSSDPTYLALDGVNFPTVYTTSNLAGLVGKIDISGNVVWQKAISSSEKNATGFYTNINVDENKNFYAYLQFKDKVTVNGVEYIFSTTGDKVISKFDTNGNIKYFSAVDNGTEYGNGTWYNSRNIDVIGDDLFNLSGITYNNQFLNYAISNTTNVKFYAATFGNLPTKYFTPKKNYLEISAATIPNNLSPQINEFSFDLINNVNWTATSDQAWLNLSSISLTSKSPQQTITGNGDAKITLTADENTTGVSRSSNVIISGEGVPSKTIIVSQTATLGVNNNALSIITLYPNPTSDFLNIKTSQKISKIEIYDMSGKLIKSERLKEEKINVQSLLKGNYLLKIQTENGVVNSKFIKN